MKKIIILSITLIFLCSCSNHEKELNVNSKNIQNLYNMVNPSEDALVLDNLYKNPEHLNNEIILAMGIKNYINKQPSFIEIIPQEEVEKNIYTIFGNDIIFNHNRVYILSGNYCGFEYNQKLKQYEILKGCDGSTNHKYYRKIISAKEKEDTITILEKSIYVEYDLESINPHTTIFNNIKDKKIIKEFKNQELNINIDDYLQEASTYQYNFKNVKGTYIFKGINLLK